jgi:hypothetical protein
MTANQAPQAHQVRIRELATGRVFLAWPVDAREMLIHPKGGFEAVDDSVPLGDAGTPAPPPAVVTPPSIGEQLEKWALKDLQTLAARVDIDPTDKSRTELVALLSVDLPELVSAGVVSLEQLPELKITPEQFPIAAPAE